MDSLQSNLERNIIAELTLSEFKAYGKVTGIESDSTELAWEQTSGPVEQSKESRSGPTQFGHLSETVTKTIPESRTGSQQVVLKQLDMQVG